MTGLGIISSSKMDEDAIAFLSAASITDSTQMYAVSRLVKRFKDVGVWSKMFAIYPFVGGTSTTHKYNLKDPRDLDAAYRLVFSGGWTHASTGATPNGSTGIASTFLVPSSSSLQLNSTHVSYYSRTNDALNAIEIGATSTNTFIELYCRWNDIFYGFVNQFSFTSLASNTDSRGYFSISRTASNALSLYRNGSSVKDATNGSTSLPTNQITIGAVDELGTVYYSTRECAFATIGLGLTASEESNIYTIIQEFQTTLSRQV